MKTQEQMTPGVAKIAGIALAGTSIEWYDFFLYGTAAALVFPALFFPQDLPPLVALLASFATFAVGFIARPVGGVVFGHFGDRHGRKRALVVALVLMGLATTFIGLLPTYSVAGPVGTVSLILLRFLQGLAIGGQWGGAMLLVTETAPRNRRGFYGSFAQLGAPVGVVLANLVFLCVSVTLSQQAFMSWGWRLPFIASSLLIALALYIHVRLEETPSFKRLQRMKADQDADSHRATAAHQSSDCKDTATVRGTSPVLEALRTYPVHIALAAGAFMAIQVAFYILTTFVIAYGTNPSALGMPRNSMLIAVMIGAVAMIPAVLASAAISDRLGRRGIYLAGALLLAGWSFAIFPLMETRSLFWIVVAISVGQFFVGMMYGPQAALLTEIFSTKVRYSGASLAYQLGAILGGAVAPLLATTLLAKFQSSLAISVYIATACVITGVSILLLKETYGTNLDHQILEPAASESPPRARQRADALMQSDS